MIAPLLARRAPLGHERPSVHMSGHYQCGPVLLVHFTSIMLVLALLSLSAQYSSPSGAELGTKHLHDLVSTLERTWPNVQTWHVFLVPKVVTKNALAFVPDVLVSGSASTQCRRLPEQRRPRLRRHVSELSDDLPRVSDCGGFFAAVAISWLVLMVLYL